MSDVRAQLMLVDAWRYRGDTERALARCRDLLDRHPGSIPVHLKLVELALQAQRTAYARDVLGRAYALAPHDPAVHRQQEMLLGVANARLLRARAAAPPGGSDEGRIDLRHQFVVTTHRSGWQVAVEALFPLHNPAGVRFDGFVERNFAWRHPFEGRRSEEALAELKRRSVYENEATSEERGVIPYRAPWIGFVHNPPGMPPWFHPREAPRHILAKDAWRRSAEHCRGLFTLSEYHANWVRRETGLPVVALRYPTDLDVPPFDMACFLANPRKQIVQVGWWLRRLDAVYQLPLARGNPAGYVKTRLVTQFFDNAHTYFHELLARERAMAGGAPPTRFADNTREMAFLPPAAYDALLAQNIVFLSLYDASGCTTLTECMARATPLLVNPLPAIVEYLGQHYPFYFDTLEEAAAKALDFDLVQAAHRYLLASPRRHDLAPERFREAFRASAIYGGLGAPA